MGEPLRIVIADDQALMRQGFRMILSAEPDIEVVGEADTGVAAIRQVTALRPDVVLMDITMPVIDGIAATRTIADADSSSFGTDTAA